MSIKQANRDINALQPLAQKACRLFLQECKNENVKIFITETHRSQARQNYLYEQGRTRPGKQVTWTKNSNHKGGWAWDIAVSPPKALYDSSEIAKAGKIAAKLGIEWGGTWKRMDTPHFQINKNWVEPKGAGYTVQDTKINLNGKVKTVKTVNIKGNNYIKLQDIRDEKIIIDYDNVKKIPIIRVK